MSDFDVKTLLFLFDQLSDTYLRAEVEEALNHREELTPHLITILETVADNPQLYLLEQRNAHIYAVTLLAHFGEIAAHQPIIRAFSIHEDPLFDIWGDMVTETLPALLYQTSGGSMDAIKALVVNREIDQYVRCSAMEALSYQVAFQPFYRDEIVRFFQGLFTGDEAAGDTCFWSNLAATLCDLYPGESMDILRQAYEDGLIHPTFITLQDIEADLNKGQERVMTALQGRAKSRMPADVHAYLSWFAEFNQEQPESFPAKKVSSKKKGDRPKKKTAKKAGKKSKK